MQEFKALLKFDSSEATAKLDELGAFLRSKFPGGIPDQVICELTKLSLDIVLTDSSSAILANGTLEILQGFRFGTRFESLRAAILAGEWDYS